MFDKATALPNHVRPLSDQSSRRARRTDPFRIAQIDLDRAKRWPIGQAVTVTKDDGSTLETCTRSGPWNICGTWAIQVEGISGAYALARVKER